MITFIESGNRIATENFEIGEIYTITFTNGNYKTMCCVGIGSDFVMFQDKLPNALFCLTLGTSETVLTIDLGGGGGGTMNYNELENKPQINGIVLIGNKTASDLNLVSQNDLDNYVTDTELSTELADYATNASVVSALASKQDTLTTPQLAAVNSGITSSLVNQITNNKNNILWSKTSLQFSAKAADTYEYTGLSIACPANTLIEIWAIDDNSNSRITAIAVTDSSTSIDAVGSVIGENAEPLSMGVGAQWACEVHCVTPRLYGSVHTYYVWVKRGSTGANNVTLLTRKIVTQ